MKHEPVAKANFARDLRRLMDERQLTVTALAELMQDRLPGKRFNPVNLSHYRSGRSVPRPEIMAALCQALGVEVSELAGIQTGPMQAANDHKLRANGAEFKLAPERTDKPLGLEAAPPSFHLEDLKDGQAWIQINQRLSWSTVIKLLQVLKVENS